jgi:hypothetical protein
MTQDKTNFMKSSPMYNKLQQYLIEHVCMMYMKMSYIKMCKLNQNREGRTHEREIGGSVCICVVFSW